MTFFREGKKLGYKEVVEMHQSLIRQNILPQLEIEELSNLFVKMLSFSEEKLGSYLAKGGYKVDNAKQVFESAARLRLTSDLSIWHQALEIQDKMQKQEITNEDKNDLIEFMSQKLLEAMKRLVQHPEIITR